MPETAIIIRTKNEERWIGKVLEIIFKQTYKNFEVIIVDSGSIDSTLVIAKKFPVKIFQIHPNQFSYPYALNYGILQASANKYIVILSAHSIPVSDNWLQDGLENFKISEQVAGVYGFLKPLPNTSFADKLIMNGLNFIRRLLNHKQRYIIRQSGMGVLGFTNAIIRKDLWNKRQFNEEYGAGGEDGEWAGYWLQKGCIAVKDWKFSVYHSHNLGFLGWYKQLYYWKSLANPRPFKPLLFRKDKCHSLLEEK